MSYIPRPGDYGVVKTKTIYGLVIRLFTFSRLNHAFIYIGAGHIIEANLSGVECKPLHYDKVAWNKNDELTMEQRRDIVQKALNLVGKPYSFLTILLIVFRIFGIKPLSDSKFMRRLAEKEGYICSELVTECYTESGFPVSNKPDYLTVPGDLAERLIY